ncbi:MAG: hypothetical protein AB8H47_23315 [Bacteroidia bacterium]
MKKLILLSFLCISILSLQAQYEAVVFDFDMAYFNNGQALPAEEMMIFSGEIKGNVEAVEIALYKPNSQKALYTGLWQRSLKNTGESFRLPMNYRLQGNTEYDVRISYYQSLNASHKEGVKKELQKSLSFYRQQQIQMQNGKLKLNTSASKLYKEFNQILTEGLGSYRSATHAEAPVFSPMLERYLKGIEQDTTMSSANALDVLLQQEVNKLMQATWWSILVVREVQDYPTEKIAGSLALNVGYGGILLNGDVDNFTYGSAPYVGLSIPLSNRSTGSTILQNTSVSLGAFVQNIEGPDGKTFTGPVFGRPYFAGIGYSVFRFIRINAGVVAIEEQLGEGMNGELPSFDLDRIQIQPFIGLSAEIRFSVGLNR